MVQMHIMTSMVYVLQPLSNPLFSHVFQSSFFLGKFSRDVASIKAPSKLG
jgi:hypothetical protein